MDLYIQLLSECHRQQQQQEPPQQPQPQPQHELKVCAAAGQARAEVTSLRSEKGRVDHCLQQADERVHSLQQVPTQQQPLLPGCRASACVLMTCWAQEVRQLEARLAAGSSAMLAHSRWVTAAHSLQLA